MGYTRIAVHGESIGGMVACHVAHQCQGVELLIADRTFCTLAAVADRLVAPWAGKAMQLFTGSLRFGVVTKEQVIWISDQYGPWTCG